MVGSRFETQVANLEAWIAARDALSAAGGNRASVTLQLTFMASNIAEIPEIVRLAARTGVDRVKGHHLWAHFAAIAGDDLRRSHDSVQSWNACAMACARIVADTPLPGGRRLKLENFEPLPEVPAASGGGNGGARTVADDAECPFLGREAWVNHAGAFAPCCAPDAERASLGDFGNARAPGGLLAIWRSAAYAELVATYKSKPLCSTCQMRRPRTAAVAPAVVAGGNTGAR